MRRTAKSAGLVAVIVFGSLAGARADGIPVSLKLPVPSTVQSADGYVDVRADATELSADPARPRLPVVHLTYALPPDADPASVSVVVERLLEDERSLRGFVRPAPPWQTSAGSELFYGEAKDVADGRDRAVYERDADYPAEAVRLAGVSQMRKWKLARVAVNPVLYNPVSGRLKEIREIDFRIDYARAGRPVSAVVLADSVMDAAALEMIENETDARAWYPAAPRPAGVISGTVYLVMTTDEVFNNSTNLHGLVAHKRSVGYEVHVVTETKLDGNASATGWNEVTGQSPDGRADRMRKWLQDNYVSMGIEYVLLIGNPAAGWGDLPMKECHYQAYVYPVDAYFSDLTGNWDIDGNGFFGNETNDISEIGGVDFFPEVYVGRIPVYNGDPDWPRTLRRIIRKSIRYELEHDIEWRRAALLPESFSNLETDGAYLGECARTNFLAPRGYSAYTLYEQGTVNSNYNSVFPSDEELVDNAPVKHWMNNAYGLVLWWAHGWSRGAVINSGGDLFYSFHTPALRDDRPAALFMSSCNCGEPGDEYNISYAMLCNGGIASVAAGNVSWFYTCQWSPLDSSGMNASMGYHFFRKAVSNQVSFGRAMAEVRYDGFGWWNNQYTFSLYGDPSLSLVSQGDDTDGDSMPDPWEDANGLAAADPSDAGGDPDIDGYTNLEEYEAGLDPQADDQPSTHYASMSVAATFNGWNAGASNMRLIADETWQGDLDLTNASGVEFKFAANGTWTTNWGEYDQLATNVPLGGAADWESGNIVLVGTLDGRYRFRFNELTRAYRVDPAPDPDSDGDGMPDAWEAANGLNSASAADAAGNPDHDAYNNLQEYQRGTDPWTWNWPRTALGGLCVAGTFNGWTPGLTNMCLVGDYLWRWDASFTNVAGAEFKFAANGGWTTNWGDDDQAQTNVPMAGMGESYGANIRIGSVLNGSYRFTFNELTLAYGLEAVSACDTDGDGIEDGWESDHGLSSKSGQDAWGDADADGLVNLHEFGLGGDPADSDTDDDGAGDFAEAIAGTGVADGGSFFDADADSSPTNLVLSWPGATGRTYAVYASTGGLAQAEWMPLPGFTNIEGAAGSMRVDVGDRPADSEFFKVRVRRP